MMPSKTLILDTEVYRNFFYLGIKRLEDSVRVGFEFSDRADFDRDKVRLILRRNLTVGFNSLPFDLPVIYVALNGASNSEIKDAADHLIQNRIPPWQAERELGILIPELNHVDLFETSPAVKDSLKSHNGRMHMKRLQDLPYDPAHVLSHEEMDETIDYCQFGDIDGTEQLYKLLQEPIHLREVMREKYRTIDLRSKSDAQVGETIIKTEVERKLGTRVKKAIIPEGTAFRYQPPEWMRFETPMMREVFKTICETDILVGKGGKIDLPKSFAKFNIEFDGTRYALGIGGLHSTESNRSVHSDDTHILIDADVASQYPSIIMKLGLFPKALGRDFLPVYKSIIDARLAAKKAKDKVTDKGLKIAINGSYGKLGSAYSTLFAPHLMVAVTLTGQLSLLMLIEKAHLAGIPVVSGNTDGVVFRCPRSLFSGFVMRDGKPTDRLMPSPIQDVIEWWEGVTSFNLEFAEYKAIYSQSVNTYIALKANGTAKRKGALANHWNAKSPDYDPMREGLKKNPQMTICSDAVLAFLQHGTPIEQTIRECKDIREFITVIKADGGATWREGYLGKVVRYYWSTDGDPIIKVKGHPKTGNRPKVPKTDGCRPAMNLPDDFPADVDLQRYIDEAYSILKDIGFQTSHAPWVDFLSLLLKIN